MVPWILLYYYSLDGKSSVLKECYSSSSDSGVAAAAAAAVVALILILGLK
jgi:hypothetical protein